jgi:hypothetical protein
MKATTKVHHETCGCDMCSTGFLEHPRYFPRQMITPVELTLEHDYQRDKMRRHNRLLHGWGVVCGAKVCPIPKETQNGETVYEPWKVRIEPGYILGPYGDEIIIDCARVFDVRTKGVLATTGEACGEVLDPWCAEVYTKCPPECIYIAVKYHEVRCRPVRVQPIGCGCDDMQCEYSRIRDGYEITALLDCPPSHHGCPSIPFPWPPVQYCPPTKPAGQEQPVPKKEESEDKGKHDEPMPICLPDCPPCPSDPWVVLAEVCVNDKGCISKINNCYCRRLVMSFANTWGHCGSAPFVYSCEEDTETERAKGEQDAKKARKFGVKGTQGNR